MRSWPLLIALSLGMLLGCTSDSNKKPPEPDPTLYLPATSIPNVLANLTRAYKEKNYGEYRKLLDAPFEYVFAPQDVGGPNNIPGSWGLADELVSANNMFSGLPNRDHYWAEKIKLAFTAGADTPTEMNPNWRKVVVSNVNLEIESREMTIFGSPDLPGHRGQSGAVFRADGRDRAGDGFAHLEDRPVGGQADRPAGRKDERHHMGLDPGSLSLSPGGVSDPDAESRRHRCERECCLSCSSR